MEYNGKKIVRMVGVKTGKLFLIRLLYEDGSMESVSSKALKEKGDRTYLVIEMCGECGNEVEMAWDTDLQGYKATCPYCGKPLLLCDECLHSEDNETQRCDWNKETGCSRCPKK